MPFGIRIKDAAGALTVDYTFNIPRYVRDYATGVADGAVYVPEWETSPGTFVALEALPTDLPAPASTGPNVWKDGAVLRWAWPSYWNWTKTGVIIRVWVY